MLLVLVSTTFFISCGINDPYKIIEKEVAGLNTEKQIVKRFGEPRHKFFKGDKNYYIKGYSAEQYEIEHKLFVYFPTVPEHEYIDLILYVYIDDVGTVTNYFVGGS